MKIQVFCGESIEYKCGQQIHPAKQVLLAKDIIDHAKTIDSSMDRIFYSNDPDFVRGIKYIGLKEGVETEFFLNGISCGSDIEFIFNDFNRSLDLINELGATEE